MYDMRWQQRFDNFEKALMLLIEAVDLSNERSLTDLEKQGLIQRFEFTHELAWNVMKDYFEYQGNNSITGSRDATREAFKFGIITNGDVWMDMLKSRNLSSHTYDEVVVNDIVDKIFNNYMILFRNFEIKMKTFK